jgi:hypothetical protein
MGDYTKPTGKKRSLACRACHRELQHHWGTGARASCPPHRSCIVLRRVGGTPRPQRGETATTTRHSLRLKTAAPRRRPEGIRFSARRSYILKRFCQHRALNVQGHASHPIGSAHATRDECSRPGKRSANRLLFLDGHRSQLARARIWKAHRSRPLYVFLIWYGWRRGSGWATVERT